jgi:prepilin-type N-terminal cleavage/methylation domain-containing protein
MEVIMNIINNLKLKNRKGFTLVEVIVVLVVLAILATIAIPALTGYIDKANQRKLSTEDRDARMAMQTMLIDEIAEGKVNTTDESSVSEMLVVGDNYFFTSLPSGYRVVAINVDEQSALDEWSHLSEQPGDWDFQNNPNWKYPTYFGIVQEGSGTIVASMFFICDSDGIPEKVVLYNLSFDSEYGVNVIPNAGYRVVNFDEIC